MLANKEGLSTWYVSCIQERTSSNLWRQFLGCLHFYRRLDTSTILSCTLRARSPFPAPFRTRLRSAPSLAISGDDTFFFFRFFFSFLFSVVYSSTLSTASSDTEEGESQGEERHRRRSHWCWESPRFSTRIESHTPRTTEIPFPLASLVRLLQNCNFSLRLPAAPPPRRQNRLRRLMSVPCASISCTSPPLSPSRPNFPTKFILPENLLCRLSCFFLCNWAL